MVLITSILLALGGHIASAAHIQPLKRGTNTLCQGGQPAAMASILVLFPPAQMFCTLNYPVPAITTTVTGSARTVTSTATARTLTTTVATRPTTVVDRTVTQLTTSTVKTVSAFTTSTVIGGVGRKRREASPLEDSFDALAEHVDKRSPEVLPTVAVDADAALLGLLVSVQANPVSFVAAFCTCLETQPTKTITATPSTKVTSTPTVTSSAIATNTIRITTTTTIVSPATQTVLATTTATVTPVCTDWPSVQCFKGAKFQTQCNVLLAAAWKYTLLTTITLSNQNACLQACVDKATCTIFQFTPIALGAGACLLYGNAPAGLALTLSPALGTYFGIYIGRC